MRLRALASVLIVALATSSFGQAPEPAPTLAELRAGLEDPAIPVAERARRALEVASTLDQAAQRTSNPAERQARWNDAIALLDGFVSANPEVESARLIRFQAGVYAWAVAQGLVDRAELSVETAPIRLEATKGLEAAVGRLRAVPLKPDEATQPFGQNLRFRLAQAIADRARLLPERSPGRLDLEREALGLLDPMLTAPRLGGFARLLRSDLAGRLGLFGQAQLEVEEAAKADPPPPIPALLAAKVTALAGREMFAEARAAIDAAKVDEPLKGLLRLRVVLDRRAELPPGKARGEVDAEAFRIAETFRGSSRPESRRGLIELARAIDEPTLDAPAEWWDLLAEGHLRLGDPSRAGRLDAKGGDRAEALGKPELAATLRFRAGGCLFEAEKFEEADARLSSLVASPTAPRATRARAGMLRALARGRGLALKQPWTSRKAYLDALESQTRDFGDDPASGEARWLLGKARLASGDRAGANQLWAGIAHGNARWLEAQLASAELLREDVEGQRINRDAAASRKSIEIARNALRKGLDQASDGLEAMELGLRKMKLELIPEAGSPGEALETCDRLLRKASTPEQHELARLGRMVALAQLGRFLEAERIAREDARVASPRAVLPALRLLDRSATDTDGDLSRRRFGLILRIFTSRFVDRPEELDPADRDEVRVRHIRALIFSGDLPAARSDLTAWGGPGRAEDEELLRSLADMYLRLDAFDLAAEAERLRASRLLAGSPLWFDARYGLALAYFRSDRF
jgi:hypothetical protein